MRNFIEISLNRERKIYIDPETIAFVLHGDLDVGNIRTVFTNRTNKTEFLIHVKNSDREIQINDTMAIKLFLEQWQEYLQEQAKGGKKDA